MHLIDMCFVPEFNKDPINIVLYYNSQLNKFPHHP